jgi:hypothetical protein
MTRSVEHEIRPILARELGGAINQPAHVRFDTDVESVPFGPFPLRNMHDKHLLKPYSREA